MSSQVKSYILAPTWDYPPNGPLKLGSIIVSPSQPVPALLSLPQPPTAATTSNSFSTTKHDVSWSHEKQLSGHFGIWTSFLQFMGVDVGLEMSRGRSDVFEFDTMVTEERYPDDEAVAAAVTSSPRAMQFLARHGLRPQKGLFVIVGVKTVSGARVRRKTLSETGVESEVSLDAAVAAAAGVPVSLGPSAGLHKSESDDVSFQGSDDFVFAFRVRRIKIAAGGKEVTQEDYRKGALYSSGKLHGGESGEGSEKPVYSILGLEENDFVSEDAGLEKIPGLCDDNGEEVLVFRSDSVM
ncbi:hypothetical protein MN608_06715 [Microdochium nivale]|nr:hypothetical protein MN608_06715 [Microdochium nivale]